MSKRYREVEVREYVESELTRTVEAHQPDLKVVRGSRWEGTTDQSKASKHTLMWTIEGVNAPSRGDYVVEARVKEGEVLIWFGYYSAGGLWTHHLIRPAVHLSLDEVMHLSRKARGCSGQRARS